MAVSHALLACSLLSAGTGADTRSYRGLAADQKTGKMLYTERHVEESREGRTASLRTEYLDMDGNRMAERVLDFSRSPSRPAYRFKDFRTGWEEGATEEKGRIRVYVRKGRGKQRKMKILTVPTPAVIDAGFNAFLKQHIEELDAGKRIEFYFVVPSRLAYYRFVAFEDKTKGREGLKVLAAEPDNALLRLVAPHIQLLYDPATGRMTEYQGVSNLSIQTGGRQNIRLVYPEGAP